MKNKLTLTRLANMLNHNILNIEMHEQISSFVKKRGVHKKAMEKWINEVSDIYPDLRDCNSAEELRDILAPISDKITGIGSRTLEDTINGIAYVEDIDPEQNCTNTQCYYLIQSRIQNAIPNFKNCREMRFFILMNLKELEKFFAIK